MQSSSLHVPKSCDSTQQFIIGLGIVRRCRRRNSSQDAESDAVPSLTGHRGSNVVPNPPGKQGWNLASGLPRLGCEVSRQTL